MSNSLRSKQVKRKKLNLDMHDVSLSIRPKDKSSAFYNKRYSHQPKTPQTTTTPVANLRNFFDTSSGTAGMSKIAKKAFKQAGCHNEQKK